MGRGGWWAIVAVVLLWAAEPASAQGVTVGARAGIGGHTVAWSPTRLGDDFDALERRKTFTGGVWVARPLLGRVGLRGEVLWTGKGFIEAGDELVTTLAADYVEVPLLLTLDLGGPFGPVVPELFAGGWIAVEAGCAIDVEVEGTDAQSFDCDELPEEPVLRETTDWGVALGGSLRLRTGSRIEWMLDARYTAGLRNIDRSPAVDNFDIRHRGVAVTLGAGIGVGR